MFGRKRKQDFTKPLTLAEWEQSAEVSFREARRTGSAVHDAHGRIAELHAERLRRGLATVDALPAEVLRRWDWNGATAILRAHISN